ncbi:MAG: BNR-4 repeat-containing protein [Phycisphaerae bacterium]
MNIAATIGWLSLSVPVAYPAPGPAVEPELLEGLDVGRVWAGHPVEFALLTVRGRQFVAYYDADRRMTLAARRLDESEWTYRRLDSKVEWDSHNYIVLAADAEGFLHLSGNMHNVPLIYFQTDKPLDVRTFRRVPHMVGRDEEQVTYPIFLAGPDGELLFNYRDGRSGAGRYLYNVYDPGTRTWRRLLDQPLIDGQGQRGAYPNPLVRDRRGVYHLCWVWRDSGDCSTNHDVCYARSRDLVHWEKSDGEPLKLPMTLETAEYVARIPPRGGLINGNAHVGFDLQDRPVVSYHKFDEAGHTQVYNARVENGQWKSRQVSRWDYRWYFQGGGAIEVEISIGAVQADGQGRLTQAFAHPRAGRGRWLLDPETLTPIEVLPALRRAPAALGKPESTFPAMRVQWVDDAGDSGDPGVYYLLRWETLPANRDRPRAGDPPPPSMLRVLKLRRPD